MLDVMSEIGHNDIGVGTHVYVLAGVLWLRHHPLPDAVLRGGGGVRGGEIVTMYYHKKGVK